MSTDARIGAQVAAKAAAALYQGTGLINEAMAAMERIYNGITILAGPPPQDSPPVSQQPLAQPALAQAQANLGSGGVQAAVVRDLSSEEARWQDALNNYPNDWYNNVGNAKAASGGGKGPDFRFKEDNADVTPLWLNGKYGPAPAWVFERLNLQFPGAPALAAAPVQPAAPAPILVGPPVPAAGEITAYGPGEAPF